MMVTSFVGAVIASNSSSDGSMLWLALAAKSAYVAVALIKSNRVDIKVALYCELKSIVR
jgi:hypothetical protein